MPTILQTATLTPTLSTLIQSQPQPERNPTQTQLNNNLNLPLTTAESQHSQLHPNPSLNLTPTPTQPTLLKSVSISAFQRMLCDTLRPEGLVLSPLVWHGPQAHPPICPIYLSSCIYFYVFGPAFLRHPLGLQACSSTCGSTCLSL